MTHKVFRFTPKEGGEDKVAKIIVGQAHDGFDLVLFLDSADNPTDDSGWMLELGINKDGSVNGQITAHPGYDALAMFDCSQDTLSIQDNWGGPVHVISEPKHDEK